MKKYIAAALMVLSAGTFAADVVVVTGTAKTLSTTGAAGSYTLMGVAGQKVGDKFFVDATAQAGSFVKIAFTVTAGNGVISSVQNDASKFSVASTPVKGNQIFGGNSTVGAVKLLGACAASPCAESDATGTKGIQAAVALTS
jgi:hypothetical protein